jgi:hypothetical protein
MEEKERCISPNALNIQILVTPVPQILVRRWCGVEIGEHFFTTVPGLMVSKFESSSFSPLSSLTDTSR